MRLYLAGKMTVPGWRAPILDTFDAAYVREFVRLNQRWPIHERAIFGCHDYAGPFLMDDEEERPGHAAPGGHGRSFVADNPMAIRDLCCAALHATDVVFAWINTQSAYGTFAELGYAHAIGKPIWLAGPRFFPELWFTYSLAERIDFEQVNPAAVLRRWLGLG